MPEWQIDSKCRQANNWVILESRDLLFTWVQTLGMLTNSIHFIGHTHPACITLSDLVLQPERRQLVRAFLTSTRETSAIFSFSSVLSDALQTLIVIVYRGILYMSQ